MMVLRQMSYEVRMRLGAMELKLLQFLQAEGPMTVRQAANTFGADQGVVLTTVQQMLERLRKKGMVMREKTEGGWSYRAMESREGVLRGVVGDFVERTLGGSLEPFALYLAGRPNLSAEEIRRLREVVEQLRESDDE